MLHITITFFSHSSKHQLLQVLSTSTFLIQWSCHHMKSLWRTLHTAWLILVKKIKNCSQYILCSFTMALNICHKHICFCNEDQHIAYLHNYLLHQHVCFRWLVYKDIQILYINISQSLFNTLLHSCQMGWLPRYLYCTASTHSLNLSNWFLNIFIFAT